MKQYISIFRMRFIAQLQYRAAAWAGVATQFFWGFMLIMIYEAFYSGSGKSQSMSFEQLVPYIWLQQAFLAMVMLWYQDSELLAGITNGNVAFELCRPYNLFVYWYVRVYAMRMASVTLRFFPILIITFLLPGRYRMILPPDLKTFLIFLLSIFASSLLVVAISMYIYIATFITLSASGSKMLVSVAADFFCGGIIPIPLMPEPLQKIVSFFPFKYTADVPFRIYSGNIPFHDALNGIGIQMLWFVGLMIIGYFLFTKVIKRAVIQGG